MSKLLIFVRSPREIEILENIDGGCLWVWPIPSSFDNDIIGIQLLRAFFRSKAVV